ncbi:lactate/malate family dehydrogenase [Rickettsiales endosymbiont of Stachyamoeba lipophora]|uniref:lactate/malate family dehydrogenase n=1 Tax=Rickettsiales endosymbiont of Stachyamoeba lipophora TaxID=2486578 RepID=UPI000F646C9E|nr:hypothetical protein [Rickettsiales endosymbiont of Stachyamoeba lipophora]AZL16033.1 hypothetical protein EF513_05725 [Rickettsiales endosymbiont of Stachyamoeba lipophora]
MKTYCKVGIIGAGDIGFNLAEILALKGYDVIIYNRYHKVEDKPSPYWLSKMGRLMDINDALQLPGCGKVSLVSDLSELSGVNFIVITTGVKRTSNDETREELAGKNAVIMQSYINFIADHPMILVLMVANPVDFLTSYLIRMVAKKSGKKEKEIAKKIVGVSYVDTMRLINAVKEFIHNKFPELENPVVEGIAIGEHGPNMVPLMSGVTINAKPLTEFASYEQIQEISNQTILRGNDIIKLTGTSSVLGPSHAAMHMIEQIDGHAKVRIPCSVWDGKRAMGQLTEFLAREVNTIISVKQNSTERQMINNCQTVLDNQYQVITELLKPSIKS